MPQNQRELKARLRADVRTKISAMDRPSRETESRAIVERILAAPEYVDAQTVMLFRAVDDEPNLDELALAAIKSGKQICFPLIDWAAHTMSCAVVTSLTDGWLVRRHGIPEPVSAPIIESEGLDLVLAPGVAFDLAGRRLGRGAGFYDRFLASVNAPAWGVGFKCQLAEEVPCESHDVRLAAVVTPPALYRCH